ncbi:hypothetical protein TCAL_06869 [Tigriopus californicus]|uniref:SAM domain-containing protein n=2 Tax=Tigriopus californicus TaxID=6832 RepID=A0A553NG58_TIGCA|nr:hypothetical protein TCAL_06869 [Tigriopus californicus]|eukprot:TCALIF_06869-PA protein Name:"Similar to Stim Stromal interaction molecule homolog (Drosophila melanogaster)" AED:0.42 eAED:0.43 QI:0/-1/0/1/-1/1/1/0/669
MMSPKRIPPGAPSSSLLSVFLIVLICVLPWTAASSPEDLRTLHELEYRRLYETTLEKEALEAIRSLHQQLDDDNDGTIEPSETGDFIRGDLQYGSDKRRQTSFHHKDSEITVKDLWLTWRNSEVYNWTVDNVVDWLEKNVDLPQYAERFRDVGMNGTHLPKAAVGSSYLNKVLGISNPIHRSKISLKAMDVVLFGPPRDTSNVMKDVILTSLLVMAVTGLFYAYRQNKKSQQHLQRMMTDMDSLAVAEQTLQELQEKLHQKDSKIESLSSTPTDHSDSLVMNQMREELEILRNELHRAELELEDKCWVAPPVLQHWLQLTYEMESQTYNAKKKAAEEQLEVAKDMCEKLKRKRSSLVGAFVSTHGRSIDDVDRYIMDAKTALMEVTKDLTERSQRWRQIEILCGCPIVTNPGLLAIQGLIRHVGGGRGLIGRGILSSRMSGSASQDDLMMDDNMDAMSVAASSAHMSRSGAASLRSAAIHTSAVVKSKKRQEVKTLSRESSKESSSSDEYDHNHHGHLAFSSSSGALRPIPSSSSFQHDHKLRSATPPAPSLRTGSSPLTEKRSKMMVKSLSQDAGGSIQNAAASSVTAMVVSSVSDGQLHDSMKSNGSLAPQFNVGPPSNPPSIVEELEESCSASDTGSMSELSMKPSKKKTFFGLKIKRKNEKKALT